MRLCQQTIIQLGVAAQTFLAIDVVVTDGKKNIHFSWSGVTGCLDRHGQMSDRMTRNLRLFGKRVCFEGYFATLFGVS